MTIDQKSVEVLVRALFDLLIIVCMYYTMVMQHGIRKDYERVYEQNQAVLELLQSLQAGTIQALQPIQSTTHASEPVKFVKFDKESRQLNKAIAWLEANPEYASGTARELAVLIRVSRTTVTTAKRAVGI